MVRGLNKFKEYFAKFHENYVIIGGTACDMIIGNAGFTPRATKDIDIILVVEALDADFVRQFWKFIQDGHYERNEKSADERKYYRFVNPEERDFPFQIELFARNPDLIVLDEFDHLTPIPVDDDLSSLSAILLNDHYYEYMIEHSIMDNELRRANTEALITLKAKAWNEIKERIDNGSIEDSKHLRKHKADIFRLAVMFTETDVLELPETIKADLQTFADAISDELPDKAIFKEMGLPGMDVQKVFGQLKTSFKLK